MGQTTPYKKLDKLPPRKDRVEALEILKMDFKTSRALGELKGIAETMPNQTMLINAVVLQEANDTKSVITNIFDELQFF